MAVVRDRGIFAGGVTLQADAVSRRTKLCGVRLVTIAAGDAGREHPALLERAVVVDLVQHLPVGTVEPARQRRGHACPRASAPAPTPRKTRRGARDTGRRSRPPCARAGRDVPARVARGRIDRPDDTVAFVEPHQQTFARVIALAERPPALLRPGPAGVPRPLSMTRLAAHADLREARGEAVGRRVVILAHAGRMASRAHEIPVLVQPGPVQHVVVLDLLVRIEMEPALAASILRPGVPRERQRLQAAVGKLDQILLQRLDAERVLDLKRRQLAVGPIGLDEKLPILAEEAGSHAVMVDSRIAEIAEHRFVVRMLHGKLVLRAVPELACARWQPAQVSLPTKVAAEALAMFLVDPFKSWYPRPIATRITAASAAAVQILCFHSRLKLDRGYCGSLVCIAPAELFRDPLFLADLGR